MNGIQLRQCMESLRSAFDEKGYSDELALDLADAGKQLNSVNGFSALNEDYRTAVQIYHGMQGQFIEKNSYLRTLLPNVS